MTSISSSPNSALLILQAQSSAAIDKTTAAAPDLVATANGQPSKQTVGVSTQPTQAESKISDALFSVNNRSITQMKLDLIERTGEELGVKKDDYASTDDFVAAMKKVVTNIKAHKGWEQVVAKIEKDMNGDDVKAQIEESFKLADALGLNGTPSYVVGKDVVVGAVGLDALKEKINSSRCGKPSC